MTFATPTTYISSRGLKSTIRCQSAHKQAFFIVKKLSLAIALSISATEFSMAAQERTAQRKFSTGFLKNGGQGIDLTDFLKGNSVVAGHYRVDVLVNGTLVGRQGFQFAKHAKTGRVEACITAPILESLGVNMKPLREAGKLNSTDRDGCYDLPSLIERSSIDYNPSRQHLKISIPQAAMSRSDRGYVDPALWDEGVTTGFVNYSANGRRNTRNGISTDSYSVGLRNGLNLGPWRLRNESNLNNDETSGTTFTSNRTFAQRDITSLKSQLTLGTTYSNSSIFDSVRIKGGALDSDDSMLPDSQRGYAPVIRGDADTNATVEIRQNGYLLSSTNVSPGPFLIDDIYPNGSNGDLEITVIEADGRRRVTTQAFASLPQMVRRGMLRHNVAIGQYDSNGQERESPMIGIAGLAYGLTDNTTVFGGLQWAPDFNAVNLGATQGTAIGAFSADVTQSASTTNAQRNTGQSARLTYAKTLESTDTQLSLSTYRYSTEGYRTLDDHISDLATREQDNRSGRAKSRLNLTLTQPVGPQGNDSLYLTLGEQRYWDQTGKTRQLALGYSGRWGLLNYNLNASHSTNAASSRKEEDMTRLAFSVSFPLGANRSTYIRNSLTRDSTGVQSLQSSVNGNVMGRNDAFYSVTAGHESTQGKTLSTSLSATTSMAQFNAGYAQGENYTSLNAGATGSIVAHAGGVNLGQQVGESFSLVEVSGVIGVPVSRNAGVTTGLNGYAVVPNVQPYRTNWISVDASQLGADIDIENLTQQVIPRRGSVTVARFDAKQGRRVQFELVKSDGAPMPFGASVENEQGAQLSITDPTGNALVLTDSDQGTLIVKSGGQACRAAYSLPERVSTQGYERLKLMCQ